MFEAGVSIGHRTARSSLVRAPRVVDVAKNLPNAYCLADTSVRSAGLRQDDPNFRLATSRTPHVLRIAFILPDTGIGGGNSVMMAHARVAAEVGHDATIVVSNEAQPQAPSAAMDNVPFLSLSQ